jgi:hypothetical protein
MAATNSGMVKQVRTRSTKSSTRRDMPPSMTARYTRDSTLDMMARLATNTIRNAAHAAIDVAAMPD